MIKQQAKIEPGLIIIQKMKRASLSALMVFSVLAAAVQAEPPTTAPASITPAKIVVDTTAAPEFAEYGKKVLALSEAWYPKIVAMLPSEGFVAPTSITIVFDPKYDGVAATSGDRIVCSTKWFKERPEDLGAIVHELVHVVQHYGEGDRPGWLTEGIADHIRWFNYEPETARPHPNPAKAKYSDSYRTSAAFLDWTQKTYDKDLVVKLNAACREARYSDDLWKQYTGKTLEALGAEWKQNLQTK